MLTHLPKCVKPVRSISNPDASLSHFATPANLAPCANPRTLSHKCLTPFTALPATQIHIHYTAFVLRKSKKKSFWQATRGQISVNLCQIGESCASLRALSGRSRSRLVCPPSSALCLPPFFAAQIPISLVPRYPQPDPPISRFPFALSFVQIRG